MQRGADAVHEKLADLPHEVADKMYDYESRDTTFDTETLEGQAQMVGDYAEIRHSTDPADQARIKDLEERLEGTGIYGL